MAEVFQVKGIKPKKLNVEGFAKEIKAALKAEGKDVVEQYERTVETWRRKPKFDVMMRFTITLTRGQGHILSVQ
jgi:hypothetical protein